MTSPEYPPRRRRRPPYRASFTLTLLYLFGFFVLFALLFALPDLLRGVAQLPPGPEELSPEELELAKRIAQRALVGGRLYVAVGCSVVTIGLSTYLNVLPGLKRR